MQFPILFDCLKNGYSFSSFRRDVLSGLTVAIVAVPLSIAFAIASGATPKIGLFTAILGGFTVSFLGGSKYNISGPAGAFICVIFNVIAHYGYNGLLISTFMAGIFLLLFSILRLGKFVAKIPDIVVIGFSLGLGFDILSCQIPDFFGFQYHGSRDFFSKWKGYIENIDNIDIKSVFIASLTFVLAKFITIKKPKLPAFLIAIVISSLITQIFGIKIETIESRFGFIQVAIPSANISMLNEIKNIQHIPQYIVPALTIALLAGIEALLSATIADKIAHSSHRSNTELLAQGIANMTLPIFGCLPVAGTTARTIVNVNSGAKTPIAGMSHSLFILIFLALFSNLLVKINIPAIAGILFLVSVNMMSFRKIVDIFEHGKNFDKLLIISTAICVLLLGIVWAILLNSIIYYLVVAVKKRINNPNTVKVQKY